MISRRKAMIFVLLLPLLVVVTGASLSLAASAAGLSGKKGAFKVVKPPPKGSSRRLLLNRAPKGLPPSQRGSPAKHDWFWRLASPGLSGADPARAISLGEVAARRIGGDAKTDLVQRISTAFQAELLSASRAGNISAAFLIAVVAAESRGKVRATSKKGAQGLAQLMPATAESLGVTDAYDPMQNLRGAAVYLDGLLKRFNEDALLALAGYNAGPGAVERNAGVPPFSETRNYVPIVLSYFHAARQLCLAPPDGPRGPCEFPAS